MQLNSDSLLLTILVSEMENAGTLQVDSELDLFILHQVATNLFQRTLVAYVDSWNNHPIRTEGKKTPNQLYIYGLVLLKQRQDDGEFIRPRAELLQVKSSRTILFCIILYDNEIFLP